MFEVSLVKTGKNVVFLGYFLSSINRYKRYTRYKQCGDQWVTNVELQWEEISKQDSYN